MSKDYLANLSPSVLNKISENVTNALILARQREQQETSKSREEAALQGEETETPQNTESGYSILKKVFRCEHQGCNKTFRHNKDRLRHYREKHETATIAFHCPVVDCPMGFRHQFNRSDKLRDHLRGQKISSYQWTCSLPECSETTSSKASLHDHLQQHDYNTRQLNRKLLAAYGFTAGGKNYFTAKYTCSIPGCPFGTDYEGAISRHLSSPQ
jgi:hypothetical protein